MRRNRSSIKSFFVFTGITFLLALFFYLFPELGEFLYGQKLYPIIRHSFDLVFYSFEQSMMLVLIGFLLFILFDKLLRKGFWGAIRFLITLLAVFYWLWGFNYFRTSLSDKMNLTFKTIEAEDRLDFTYHVLEKCIDLSADYSEIEDNELSAKILQMTVSMADTLPYLAKANLKAVPIYPATFFLQIGITGMYFPYTGQAQYEKELGPIGKAFTMAHEWFHSAGVAPEHEANFLAYLVCVSSDEKAIQYSAYMNLLNELLFYYKITDPELFEKMVSSFTPLMKTHLEERKAQFIKYSGPISEMSDEMIDNYLKFNQQGGIKDYRRLSEYVFAWKNQ